MFIWAIKKLHEEEGVITSWYEVRKVADEAYDDLCNSGFLISCSNEED